MSPTRDTVITITIIPIIIITNMIPGHTGQASIPTTIMATLTATARAGLSALDLAGEVSVGDILTTAGDTHTMVGVTHITVGVGDTHTTHGVTHILPTDTMAVAVATTPAHIITTATITIHIIMVRGTTGEAILTGQEQQPREIPKASAKNMKMHWQ